MRCSPHDFTKSQLRIFTNFWTNQNEYCLFLIKKKTPKLQQISSFLLIGLKIRDLGWKIRYSELETLDLELKILNSELEILDSELKIRDSKLEILDSE